MHRTILTAVLAASCLSIVAPASAQDGYGRGDRYGNRGDDRYGNRGDDRYGDNGFGREDTGFYRERRDRTVYYQYDRRRYCGVQSEAQMRALGGFDKVQTVDRLRLSGRNTGACSWPNGFYRPDNADTVYLLDGAGDGMGGGRVCGISSPEQLRRLGGRGRIVVIPGNSNLEAGRGRSRPC